jgi:hypothetical protein
LEGGGEQEKKEEEGNKLMKIKAISTNGKKPQFSFFVRKLLTLKASPKMRELFSKRER